MNHIYTTKAFIIKSLPIGEANKLYFLLTKDLGFIKATAQAVSSHKSKLKGHLEDFCMVKISVVKGREIWRITNVETEIQKPFSRNADKFSIVKDIFSLLLRLLHGEEKNEQLFNYAESFYEFLSKNDLSKNNLKNLEVLMVLRILYSLGYLKTIPDFFVFVDDP